MKRARTGGMALGVSAFGVRVDAQCTKPALRETALIDGSSPSTLDKPVGMPVLADGRVFFADKLSSLGPDLGWLRFE